MNDQIRICLKKSKTKMETPGPRFQKNDFSQLSSFPVDHVLLLQRTIGNQAVQRLYKSGAIQAKLKISQPGDKYEQEADQVAKTVMQMPAPQIQRRTTKEEEEEKIQTKSIAEQITPLVQRLTVRAEEEEENLLQPKLVENSTSSLQRQVEEEEMEETPLMQKEIPGKTPEVTSGIEFQINALKGSGKPLPVSLRTFFEPRFGADFSQVRVHTGEHAAATVNSLNAQAYTIGRNVVFGAGKFAPEAKSGKRLLAHELAHVVQQDNKRGIGIARQKQLKIKISPLTPDELMKFMFSQRGFTSSPSGAPEYDPKGIGKATGKGYQTFAAIQIIDKEGAQVTVSIGAYLGRGGEHGEPEALRSLQAMLLPEELEGGQMMVAVESPPCSGCDDAIRKFAQDARIKSYKVYVPDRESLIKPGTSVTSKTAAMTALKETGKPTKAKLWIGESLKTEARGLITESISSFKPFESNIPVKPTGIGTSEVKPSISGINKPISLLEEKSVLEKFWKVGRFTVNLLWVLDIVDTILTAYLNERERLIMARDFSQKLPEIRDKLEAMKSIVIDLQEKNPYSLIFAKIKMEILWSVRYSEGKLSKSYLTTRIRSVEPTPNGTIQEPHVEEGKKACSYFTKIPCSMYTRTDTLFLEYSVPFFELAESLAQANLETTSLLEDTEIRNWVDKRKNNMAVISAIPTQEKIRLIDRLISGETSDEDINAIQIICASVKDIEEAKEIRESGESLLKKQKVSSAYWELYPSSIMKISNILSNMIMRVQSRAIR